MKICNVCGHEYLDSYESCPFCARNIAEDRGSNEPDIKYHYDKRHRKINNNHIAGVYATDGTIVTQLDQLVPSSFEALPVCPSGGIYSMDNSDPEFPRVTCSIHGSRDKPVE
jgi:hypothetical protein